MGRISLSNKCLFGRRRRYITIYCEQRLDDKIKKYDKWWRSLLYDLTRLPVNLIYSWQQRSEHPLDWLLQGPRGWHHDCAWTNLFGFHLLQHDDPHGSFGREEDGVHHHDHADGHVVLQSSQAHDPAAERWKTWGGGLEKGLDIDTWLPDIMETGMFPCSMFLQKCDLWRNGRRGMFKWLKTDTPSPDATRSCTLINA